MGSLLIIFITVCVTAALLILEGLILTKLWTWFVVPTFGLPMLSIPAAIGICLIMAFLTHQQTTQLKSGNDLNDAFRAWGFSLFMMLLIFFIGWVVTLFM